MVQLKINLLVWFLLVIETYCLAENTTHNHHYSNKTKIDYMDIAPVFSDAATCQTLLMNIANVETLKIFPSLNFTVSGKTADIWDGETERDFKTEMKNPHRNSLQVIIIPHSHNDAGWLHTFQEYYKKNTRDILNSLATNMLKYENFTFVWNDIAFLREWWTTAPISMKRSVLSLVTSKRLEITTGGWVMPDEATPHLYALLDQLIEGHEWLLLHLNTTPISGWSIDAFGHGSTIPYLLSTSGLNYTFIQRVSYTWKQWFAKLRVEDFQWIPSWNLEALNCPEPQCKTTPKGSILTHHGPFKLYTFESCGPSEDKCRKRLPAANKKLFKKNAELLMEQFQKSGFLFPHNVLPILFGHDFSFRSDSDFHQAFTFINNLAKFAKDNHEKYNIEIMFGTPRTYFEKILRKQPVYPTLSGDFFVYADTETPAAYWSGFFTTRPFMKRLGRELEHHLRNAEILYTIALNDARQSRNFNIVFKLEAMYQLLVASRRYLALFQHHDGITGTSTRAVMADFGQGLFAGLANSIHLQKSALEALLTEKIDNVYSLDTFRKHQNDIPDKLPILVSQLLREIVVFNSLAQDRTEIITIRTNSSQVKVVDCNNITIQIQINPVWLSTSVKKDKMRVTGKEFEVIFVVKLPPLSLTRYYVTRDEDPGERTGITKIYCKDCSQKGDDFIIKDLASDKLILENYYMKLSFNRSTGMLQSITMKKSKSTSKCSISFGGYNAQRGAYVLKFDKQLPNLNILRVFSKKVKIIRTVGYITSEVTVIYGQDFVHTVRIFNPQLGSIAKAIYMENEVNLQLNNTEMFMRFSTNIQNNHPPVFYTDSNGFQFQKRVFVDKPLRPEANVYPTTTMAFIQDTDQRLTVIGNHAKGVTSSKTGTLDLMIDRKLLHGDHKGLNEGVSDNVPTLHQYWFLFEGGANQIKKKHHKDEIYEVPTMFANHLSNILNYPINIFFNKVLQKVVKKDLSLLMTPFPCDIHLVNLRSRTMPGDLEVVGFEALMILQRQGFTCQYGHEVGFQCEAEQSLREKEIFEFVAVKLVTECSLTGMYDERILGNLDNLKIDAMEIKTVKLLF